VLEEWKYKDNKDNTVDRGSRRHRVLQIMTFIGGQKWFTFKQTKNVSQVLERLSKKNTTK
jgi:hypothetical protein